MKRLLAALLGAAFLLIPAQFAAATEAAEAVGETGAPQVAAKAAVLMEQETGEILCQQNAHDKLEPASVTKVMTLLLVMEALDRGQIHLEDKVVVSDWAASQEGSRVFLSAGEEITVDDLIKSVAVMSGNDATTALAEYVAGSEAAFVEQMNRRAAELGMENTRFVNCTGLDDEPDAAEHLTTARDIAVMSRELLKHDGIRQYTTIWMDTVRDGRFGLANTNKLVRFYDGTTGLKTGYTSAAGHCLAASAEREGMELIAVVLHCATSTDRFQSAKALLDYGFASYALVTPEAPEPLPAVPVELGAVDAVTPVLSGGEPVLVEKAVRQQLETSVELAPSVTAPVEQGQVLGTLTVTAGGQVVAAVPIVAPERVERLTFWDLLGRICRAACTGG